jgi:hypothetical protein
MWKSCRSIALFCLLLPSLTAAADYRVDLIVTLNRNAPPDVATTHGHAVQAPEVRAAIDISDRLGLQRAGIQQLPDAQFGLDSEWRKLRGSRLRPVLRLAWRLAQRPTATAVRFHDAFRYQVQPAPPASEGSLPGQLAYELHRLDGILLVQQSAGLRVTLDLDYSLPVNAAPADYPSASTPLPVSAAELATLSLHAEKRVNLGQTHFFDHPLLGVLLKVSTAN